MIGHDVVGYHRINAVAEDDDGQNCHDSDDVSEDFEVVVTLSGREPNDDIAQFLATDHNEALVDFQLGAVFDFNIFDYIVFAEGEWKVE